MHKHLLIFHLFIVQNDGAPGRGANNCWHFALVSESFALRYKVFRIVFGEYLLDRKALFLSGTVTIKHSVSADYYIVMRDFLFGQFAIKFGGKGSLNSAFNFPQFVFAALYLNKFYHIDT